MLFFDSDTMEKCHKCLNQSQKPTRSLFGGTEWKPTRSLFGGTESKPTRSLFGGLNGSLRGVYLEALNGSQKTMVRAEGWIRGQVKMV